jgi:hypothetical protein
LRSSARIELLTLLLGLGLLVLVMLGWRSEDPRIWTVNAMIETFVIFAVFSGLAFAVTLLYHSNARRKVVRNLESDLGVTEN